MPCSQLPNLIVHAEPANKRQTAWAWIIHREPDQMLIVRSLPEYADYDRALKAGRNAAVNISRKLSIPFAINDPGDGDRIVTAHDVRGAPD